MWKLFLSFVVIGLLNCGLAQSYWGIRAEAYLPQVWFPLPALHWGLETADPSVGFGTRAAITPLVIVNRLSVDAYTQVGLGDGSSVYAGIGVTTFVVLLPVPVSGAFQIWPYGVLGYRWPRVEQSRFFVEVQPTFGNGQFILTAVAGINWY